MATVNFSITGVSAGYSNWSGSFTVSDVNNVIKTDNTVSSVSIDPSGVNYNFDPVNAVYLWPDANLGHNYVTWRTQNIATQFPTTGQSIDIWSSTLYTAINDGAQWDELTSYSLNATKHSLVYDYDAPYAPYYSRGGTIQFTVV